jgi:hypothetical protein
MSGQTIPNFITPLEQHGRLVVQDCYEYADVVPTFAELIKVKSSVVDALIAAARRDETPQALVNWCSACALSFSFGAVATNPTLLSAERRALEGGESLYPASTHLCSKRASLNPSKVDTERSCMTLRRHQIPI